MSDKIKDVVRMTDETHDLQEEYIKEIESNPEFSLLVDPENKYDMPDLQKEFIRFYCEYKNIGAAAELAGIDADTAKLYYTSYNSQQEIRRINRAMYQRQFCTKLIDLDQIGGYLTSMLTDVNVPIADRLKSSEKLRVVELLMKLNQMKIEGMQDPTKIMENDLESQIKNLSISAITELLNQSTKLKDKNKIVAEFTDQMTPEETAYLSTLPTKDLLELLDKSNGENQ